MKLVLPDKRLKDIFVMAALDYKKYNEWHYYKKHKGIIEDCNNFFEELQKYSDGIELDKDSVATTNYWLVDDEETEIRGVIRIRHEAVPVHGNIGYDIPPSMRKKGYGRSILKLGLEKARKDLGLIDVRVTCNSDNEGSRKIILSNGGQYLKTSIDDGEFFNEYIIKYVK